jgi:hypothetical protein
MKQASRRLLAKASATPPSSAAMTEPVTSGGLRSARCPAPADQHGLNTAQSASFGANRCLGWVSPGGSPRRLRTRRATTPHAVACR